VLPAPAFIEQEGSVIDASGHLKMLWSVLDPEVDVMAPWQVAIELSERLGAKTKIDTLDDVMDEVEKFVFSNGKASAQVAPVATSKGTGAGLPMSQAMKAFSGSLIAASRVNCLLGAKKESSCCGCSK